MRIPVGYWIVDAPRGGTSPLEYGISPEGFVTGGLNHLHAMLGRLRARVEALVAFANMSMWAAAEVLGQLTLPMGASQRLASALADMA